MKTQFLIAAVQVLSLGVWASPKIETKEFSAADLKSVKVKNLDGHVKVSAAQGSQATVTVTKNKFEEKCTLTVQKNGTELVVLIDDRGFVKSHDCQVDMDISVPKSADLQVTNGAGNINIEGLHGELEFVVGSGQVKAQGEFKKLDGKSGSGGIRVDGLAGSGEIKSGSGNIEIKFVQSLIKGSLDIKSGSGNATLRFAKGTKINTDFKAGSGKLSNELGDSAGSSNFNVSMKAGSGNLEVKSY